MHFLYFIFLQILEKAAEMVSADCVSIVSSYTKKELTVCECV